MPRLRRQRKPVPFSRWPAALVTLFAPHAMPSPTPLARTPLLLRSAAWRLLGAALLSALLLGLWWWAVQGTGAYKKACTHPPPLA